MAIDFAWRTTGAPVAGRTDDIWFLDAERGWAVNSNNHILRTTDGARTWEQQFDSGGAYLRCVAFADDQRGWVGTLSSSRRLYETSDGGATWTLVEGLPPQTPPAICGLSVVNERVVYASGTNFPDRPAGVIKTVDGGRTWTGIDMSEHATLLVDIFFADEQHGWVVGGKSDVANPTSRDECRPVVLFTDDGGQTWEDRVAGIAASLPRGEWGWKIQFLTADIGFVSLENFVDGGVLKTVDGGRTWARKAVDDPQNNANLEGIGFVDASHGWVGGWGDADFKGGFTSETRDGGDTWVNANHVGKFLNRMRFIREPELVGYASGETVYKYEASDDPAPRVVEAAPVAPSRTQLPLRIDVGPDAASVRVDVWDRFGEHVASPQLEPGATEVVWSGETEAGATAQAGIYIVRIAIGDDAKSWTLYL